MPTNPLASAGTVPEPVIPEPVALQSRAKPHLAYLDGLRAVAMLWVLLNHSAFNAFLHSRQADIDRYPLYLSLSFHILSLGHYAVDIFIALSGFCLALPIVLGDGRLHGGAIRFYTKRARRILPPYYISMIVAAAVNLFYVYLGGEIKAPVTAWGIITHLLLIQDLFRQTIEQINGVLWSVSVEWRIYFLFPLMIWAWRKIGPIPATGAAVIFSYLLFRGMQHTSLLVLTRSTGSCPHYIGLFALGTLGAALAFGTQPALQRLQKIVTAPWTVIGLSLLVIVTTAATWYPPHQFVLAKLTHLMLPLERRDYLIGLWAASFMAAAAKNPYAWAFRPLSSRVLVILGTFSYSIYLVHAPLLRLFRQILALLGVTQPLQIFVLEATLGSVAAIGLSYLFHLAFERPFMSKPGQSAPKTERQAEVAAIVNPAP